MSISLNSGNNPTTVLYNLSNVRSVQYNGIPVWPDNTRVGDAYIIWHGMSNIPSVTPIKASLTYTTMDSEQITVETKGVYTASSDCELEVIGTDTGYVTLDGKILKVNNWVRKIPVNGSWIVANRSTTGNRGTYATSKAVTKVTYEHLGIFGHTRAYFTNYNTIDRNHLSMPTSLVIEDGDHSGSFDTYNVCSVTMDPEASGHVPAAKYAVIAPEMILNCSNTSPNGTTRLYVDGVLIKEAISNYVGQGGNVTWEPLKDLKVDGSIERVDWVSLDIKVEELTNTLTEVYITTVSV